MTNSSQTPSALWDSWADQQKREWLAIEILGMIRVHTQSPFLFDKNGMGRPADWNPLIDWNAWREIEEKIMEDEQLFTEWVWTIASPGMNARPVSLEFCEADLPTRARALYLAYSSLNGH